MSEFFEILCIIGMGIFGIIAMCFINIGDINDANSSIDYWQATKMYFKKAKNSYIPSLIFVIFYATTHEEWIKLFQSSDSHSFVSKAIGLVMILGFFVGLFMQYGIYKWGFKKLDAAMKKWSEK